VIYVIWHDAVMVVPVAQRGASAYLSPRQLYARVGRMVVAVRIAGGQTAVEAWEEHECGT
jgi:hypothetical protein